MIDYSALLYNPVYAALGVPATLTLPDTDGTEVEITVIDVTRRKSLMSGSAEVTGIGPAVNARIPELTAKGLTCTDCNGAVLVFSGRSWIVRAPKKQGNANGEDLGEVLLELKGGEVVTPPEPEPEPEPVPEPPFVFIDSASAGAESGGGTFSTGTIDTTEATLLIVALCRYEGSGEPTISDSESNTWNALTAEAGAGDAFCRIYYCLPTSVAADHSATATGTAYASITFAAFSGPAVFAFDLETSGSGSGTVASAGSGITPSADHALVIALTGSDGLQDPVAIDGGFTMCGTTFEAGGQHFGHAVAYLIQTTAAPANPSWTLHGSITWVATMAAFIGGFPTAATTGVSSGTTLTSVGGNLTSTSIGQTIEAQDVSGTIIVEHANVTVRDCQAYNISLEADGCTIEDCDVIGGDGNSAISITSANAIIRRCDISGTENGIWMQGTDFVIEDNYVHDLDTSGVDPHTDGVQVPDGAGVANGIIRRNNFALHTGSSSTMTLSDASNVTIDRNRLNGGTYILYFGTGATGCTITNNRFGAYTFGYVSDLSVPTQMYTGNVIDATGAALVLP